MTHKAGSEHELIRKTVREFFARELTPDLVRRYDTARRYPMSVWRRMAEMGWLGLPLPEALGGTNDDVRTAAVLVEELARGFASLAVDWVLVAMSARLLTAIGTAPQQRTVLAPLGRGELVVAFALSEPSAGTDVLALQSRAEREGREWVIHGQKLYTSMADEAEFILVLCRTRTGDANRRAAGLSLILVPARQPAITIRRLPLMGMRAAGTCEVFLDGARASADALVGEEGRGFYHLLETLDNERILAAAISLGIAEAALADMIRYASQREAFGRLIGAFQAIQHPVADSATDIKAARLLVEHAADLQSAGETCAVEAMMAKLFAAEAVVRVTDRGMRLMAAYGLVEESPMERYFRDARLQVFSPISNEMARNFIGERLGLPKSY